MNKSRDHWGLLRSIFLIVIVLACRFSCDRNSVELTLKQAIEIAFPSAGRWSGQADLVYAVSTDAEDNSSGTSGSNGKRSSWNLVFKKPSSRQNLLVAIRSGRIAYTQKVLMVYANPIKAKNLQLDSRAAVKAVKRLGIGRSSTAYHYELFKLNKTYLRVHCKKSSGRYKILTFDENTGQICRN